MAIFQSNHLLYTSKEYRAPVSIIFELKAGACVMLFYVSQITTGGFDTSARIARCAPEWNYAPLSFIVLYIPAPCVVAAIITSSVQLSVKRGGQNIPGKNLASSGEAAIGAFYQHCGKCVDIPFRLQGFVYMIELNYEICVNCSPPCAARGHKYSPRVINIGEN